MKPTIIKAPASFDGSLEELYDRYARTVLLSPKVVKQFHHDLTKYLRTKDPLYLVRMNVGQVRGQIIRTETGERIKPTDNAPAWWIHANLFLDEYPPDKSFAKLIENIPCHMFEVGLKQSINKSGWHVAHIFNVKDRALRGSTNFALRMARN